MLINSLLIFRKAEMTQTFQYYFLKISRQLPKQTIAPTFLECQKLNFDSISIKKTFIFFFFKMKSGITSEISSQKIKILFLINLNHQPGLRIRIRNVLPGSESGIIIPDPDPTLEKKVGRFNIFPLKEGGVNLPVTVN